MKTIAAAMKRIAVSVGSRCGKEGGAPGGSLNVLALTIIGRLLTFVLIVIGIVQPTVSRSSALPEITSAGSTPLP
ncbi:hypothetical protein ABZ297_07490 [Nonomuraea sp. NPDC005983]|uniref:hypothetical protein n=1 Tax=Nonomuraea sp. NPDC005983 TaxID=3155595 RepID=UPI0033A34DB5